MKEKIFYIGKIIYLYTKYQLLSKLVLFILITPIYIFLRNVLFKLSGRDNISSGDYIKFLLSIQGVGFLAIALMFFIILLALDINAFIILSALIEENRVCLSTRNILIFAIKSLKTFLKPEGLFIVIYIAIVVPLVSVGFSISATKNFKIPNFIIDVIYKNHLYFGLYLSSLVFLFIISFIHLYTFHFILIKGNNILPALKNARKFMLKNLKSFILYFLKTVLYIYIPIIIVLGILLIVIYFPLVFVESKFASRFILFFSSITFLEFVSYVTLLSLPITVSILTRFFYRYHKKINEEIKIDIEIKQKIKYLNKFDKYKISLKKTVFLFILFALILNIVTSSILAYVFDEFIKKTNDIQIIAHRAGGDLAVENSLLGLEKAIEEGAKISEIDIQRTKDGFYIVNHDNTFKRLADINKSSYDMTLQEIRNIELKDLFDKSRANEKVSTIEEFLDTAKSRIKLYIELKGSTADMKMVEDILAMVNERDMLDEIALISLNYNLIKNIEEKYPEIETGYLYFFSSGNIKKLVGDILIMEEEQASKVNIDRIHSMGKKAVVWTVNSKDSADKFVRSNIDGIITDYIYLIKDSIKERDERKDLDIILDFIFLQ